MFEDPRRGRKARNFTTNVPKILDLKSPFEQIFPKIDVLFVLNAMLIRLNTLAEDRFCKHPGEVTRND